MYDITQAESGDRFNGFEPAFTGTLEKFGNEQEQQYGKKENLIECLQSRYNVRLGRYVRHICGEIILFFPHKTGLTGMDMGQRQWGVEYDKPHDPECGLSLLTIGSDIECYPVAYHNLFCAFGLEIITEDGGYGGCCIKNPLYVYHGRSDILYVVVNAYINELRLSKVRVIA